FALPLCSVDRQVRFNHVAYAGTLRVHIEYPQMRVLNCQFDSNASVSFAGARLMIRTDENDSNSVSARAFEAVKASQDVATAIAAVRDIYEVNHVTYHLAQMIAGAYDYPFVKTTYPDAWVARYFLQGYVKIDPVVQEGFE